MTTGLRTAPRNQIRPDPPPGARIARRRSDSEKAPRRRPRRRGPRTRPPTNRQGGRRRRGAESGFVTAELAAVMPAVVAVLALGLWAVSAVGMKVRAIDAANSAAIAAARGEDPQAVAAAYLPEGASVAVSSDDTVARAVVTAPIRPLGPLTPPMDVTAEAAAPMEPGLPQ
jgi:hypothetical protein